MAKINNLKALKFPCDKTEMQGGQPQGQDQGQPQGGSPGGPQGPSQGSSMGSGMGQMRSRSEAQEPPCKFSCGKIIINAIKNELNDEQKEQLKR